MSWTWERRLVQLGGKLIVTPSTYSTSVYSPGADLRHKGIFWEMGAGQIEPYIGALRDAWAKYEQLAEVVVEGTNMNAPGKMQIGIYLASWPGRGITLHSHHALISSEARLNDLIEELRSLPAIAERVQTAMAGADF